MNQGGTKGRGEKARTAAFPTGAVVPTLILTAASGEPVPVPDPSKLVHLQFRRYAGCAFCNIHLRSFEVRHREIVAAGIHEIVVFRSTREQLQRHYSDIPYTVVLDPKGSLYRQFGVGAGLRSVFDPRAAAMALPNLVRSLLRGGVGIPVEGAKTEGLLGFPADFLIGSNGRVIASDYGAHASDGWSVDHLLALAGNEVTQASYDLQKLESSKQ